MLDETTITAVIGDMARAALAAKCIGSSMITGGTDILAATAGVRAAKAKNGALPEPMMIAQTAMMPVITRIMPIAPKPEACAELMMLSMAPMVTRPLAKVSPATISVTTLAICIPNPSKKAWMSPMTFLPSKVRAKSTTIATARPTIIALMMSILIEAIHSSLKIRISASGMTGRMA